MELGGEADGAGSGEQVVELVDVLLVAEHVEHPVRPRVGLGADEVVPEADAGDQDVIDRGAGAVCGSPVRDPHVHGLPPARDAVSGGSWSELVHVLEHQLRGHSLRVPPQDGGPIGYAVPIDQLHRRVVVLGLRSCGSGC